MKHGVDNEEADPRDREDLLGHDETAEEAGEAVAHDGHHWQDRVSHRVSPDHRLFGDPLGSSRADEVLGQHFQDAGACHPSHQGGADESQGKRRHDQGSNRAHPAV